MEWQNSFEVGHEKIDMEHRVFFDLIQSMSAAELEGASRDRVRRLISEVIKYAEFHFLSEENLMIDVGYPEFKQHHGHHQALMQHLQNYIVNFEMGDSNIHEFVNFLTDWFIKHTTVEDMQLSLYIKKSSD